MTKNPLINALAASLYITVVASVMYYGLKMGGQKDTVIIPIAVISLFTLSAAVMGYLFLYQPLQLYLEGNKKNAVNLFLQTVAIFASITIIILLVLFLKAGWPRNLTLIMFFYTYVLLSLKDSDFYIGYTSDLKRRIEEHNLGKNFSTKFRRPFKLIYYEACIAKEGAIQREAYLKSSIGHRFLKRRLHNFFRQ